MKTIIITTIILVVILFIVGNVLKSRESEDHYRFMQGSELYNDAVIEAIRLSCKANLHHDPGEYDLFEIYSDSARIAFYTADFINSKIHLHP